MEVKHRHAADLDIKSNKQDSVCRIIQYPVRSVHFFKSKKTSLIHAFLLKTTFPNSHISMAMGYMHSCSKTTVFTHYNVLYFKQFRTQSVVFTHSNGL